MRGRGPVLLLTSLIALTAQGAERSPEANYLLRCSGCHGQDGLGTVAGGVPPLPGYISHLVADAQGRAYLMQVPGVVSSGLTDVEIAAVLNYIVRRWGDPGRQAPPFDAAEVMRLRTSGQDDLVVLRRQLARRLQQEGWAVAPYPWP